MQCVPKNTGKIIQITAVGLFLRDFLTSILRRNENVPRISLLMIFFLVDRESHVMKTEAGQG